MKGFRGFAILAISSLTLLLSSCASNTPAPDGLVISTDSTCSCYVLDVPASKLLVKIPDAGYEDISHIGDSSGGSIRYFKFRQKAQNGAVNEGIILSGWIEPASRFYGMDGVVNNVKALPKNTGIYPDNIQTARVGDWGCVTYETHALGTNRYEVRAETIKSGTWIELHISAQGSEPHSIEAVNKLLTSITFTSK